VNVISAVVVYKAKRCFIAYHTTGDFEKLFPASYLMAWAETTGGTGGFSPNFWGGGYSILYPPNILGKNVSAPKIWGVWGGELEKGSKKKVVNFVVV
jgi:hypothetical protein